MHYVKQLLEFLRFVFARGDLAVDVLQWLELPPDCFSTSTCLNILGDRFSQRLDVAGASVFDGIHRTSRDLHNLACLNQSGQVGLEGLSINIAGSVSSSELSSSSESGQWSGTSLGTADSSSSSWRRVTRPGNATSSSSPWLSCGTAQHLSYGWQTQPRDHPDHTQQKCGHKMGR